MKTKIRLARFGAKKKPFYRIVVASSSASRNGRFIEAVGFYDPMKGLKNATVDKDKAKLWISRGAQPTQIVKQILKNAQV